MSKTDTAWISYVNLGLKERGKLRCQQISKFKSHMFNSLWLHFCQETNTSLGILSLGNRQILSFKKCPSKICVQLAFFWQMTSSKKIPVVPTWNDNLLFLLLPAAVRLFCTFGHGEEPCRFGDRFSWTLELLSTYFSNIMRILGYPQQSMPPPTPRNKALKRDTGGQ